MLSDHVHPAVQTKAAELIAGKNSPFEKAQSIFTFVRDEIEFGFPPKWDDIKASETLQYRLGYCNSKATLFAALNRVAGIPARVHAGLIRAQIMRGIFPAFAFALVPEVVCHSWVELDIDGEWQPLDTYINDQQFYQQAHRRLRLSGETTAFSISEAKGPSSCEFNFGETGFVQMGAVVEDHGVWDDFGDYMSSEKYVPLNSFQQTIFPIMAWICNRNVKKIRSS